MVYYKIKQIKRIVEIPIKCINCEDRNILKDVVLASTGPTQENTDYTPSFLCINCETLMVISLNPGHFLELQASVGNEVSIGDKN